MKLWVVALIAAAAVGLASSANADTCRQHYSLCVNKYGNDPKVCACARSLCLRKVGNADAGPKWNWIPGVTACWQTK